MKELLEKIAKDAFNEELEKVAKSRLGKFITHDSKGMDKIYEMLGKNTAGDKVKGFLAGAIPGNIVGTAAGSILGAPLGAVGMHGGGTVGSVAGMIKGYNMVTKGAKIKTGKELFKKLMLGGGGVAGTAAIAKGVTN